MRRTRMIMVVLLALVAVLGYSQAQAKSHHARQARMMGAESIVDYNPAAFVSIIEECNYRANGVYNGAILELVNGAGASIQEPVAGEPDRIGLIELDTGSTNAGRAMLTNAGAGSTVYTGYGDWLYQGNIATPIVSSGAQTFTLVAGFRDTTAVAAANNGVYFRKVGSGNWFFVTVAGGVETAVDTGDAAFGESYKSRLEIQIDADGSEARGYFNETLVGTSTTNIPSSTSFSPIGIYKTNGTTSRSVILDYYRYRLELTEFR